MKMFRFIGPLLKIFSKRKVNAKSVEEQANDYFPLQSPSERAAGHPQVGTT